MFLFSVQSASHIRSATFQGMSLSISPLFAASCNAVIIRICYSQFRPLYRVPCKIELGKHLADGVLEGPLISLHEPNPWVDISLSLTVSGILDQDTRNRYRRTIGSTLHDTSKEERDVFNTNTVAPVLLISS